MLAVAKDANERAQARIDALERMAQEWKSRVDSLERERSATEVKLKESEVLEEKLKERDARMKELEKELKELEEKLEEGEAKRKEQDAKLQGQDTKLHEQDAKLQIQETKLHEFTSLDTKNKELQDTIASLTKERDALRQELQHSREPDVSAISEDMNTPSFSHTSPSPQPLVKDSLAPEPESIAAVREELKETQERCTRLQQTIQSKYAEFMEMKERAANAANDLALMKPYVEKLERYNDRLSQTLNEAKKKYEKLKARNKELEKTKMTQERLESIRRVITIKDELKAMNKDLLEKNARMSQELLDAKAARMKAEEEKEASEKREKELQLKVEELEGDLRDAQNSTVGGAYGSSRAFLEQENLRLTVKVDELKQQLEEARTKGRRKREGESTLLTEPSSTRRSMSTIGIVSPSKQSRVSDLDLDDPSKCQTQ